MQRVLHQRPKGAKARGRNMHCPAMPALRGHASPEFGRVFWSFPARTGFNPAITEWLCNFGKLLPGCRGGPSGGPSGRAERIREGSLSDVERQAPGAAFFRRTVRSGSGFQPAMMRAHSRAWALVSMPGKRRRSSTAADSSPRCS